MYRVSQEKFENLINDALDTLPEKYIKLLNNVVIVSEDQPSEEQKTRLHLVHGQTLYGLYEGIPLTQRGTGYNLVLPDKITIFKQPIEWTSNSLKELSEQVHHTLWHEIAHFFGLGHSQIYKLDGTKNSNE